MAATRPASPTSTTDLPSDAAQLADAPASTVLPWSASLPVAWLQVDGVAGNVNRRLADVFEVISLFALHRMRTFGRQQHPGPLLRDEDAFRF